jgi:hypothetical protein
MDSLTPVNVDVMGIFPVALALPASLRGVRPRVVRQSAFDRNYSMISVVSAEGLEPSTP